MDKMPEIQTLMTGLVFGESPRWHNGHLWLSDWGAREVIVLGPDGKRKDTIPMPFSSFPFSFDWLPDGRLLIVSTSETPLLRQERDGSWAAHANLASLNSRGWNEIVVDHRGNAYINGGGFDLMAGEPFAPGIIAMVTPDGTARQVADGIFFPNGMVVTPDGSTLIIAESYAKRLTAFDITVDGSLSNRRVWADLPGGFPDGICMDAEGAVWYADVPNRRCTRVREGGGVLQTIGLDRGCFACALGGADNKTLFMVATEWRGPAKMFEGPPTGQVLSVEVAVPGMVC